MEDAELRAREQAEELFGARFPLISAYVDILRDEGVTWGLLGPREVDRLWSRHIVNSVAITDLIPAGSTVVDVGSGAGLPGVPLAILRPDCRITCLEPLLRRVNFLNLVQERLSGEAALFEVLRGRAEECKTTFDVATCRAVSNLTQLLKWCAPLFLPHGQLVALKGISANDEIATAKATLKKMKATAEVFSVRAHEQAETTHAIRVRLTRP